MKLSLAFLALASSVLSIPVEMGFGDEVHETGLPRPVPVLEPFKAPPPSYICNWSNAAERPISVFQIMYYVTYFYIHGKGFDPILLGDYGVGLLDRLRQCGVVREWSFEYVGDKKEGQWVAHFRYSTTSVSNWCIEGALNEAGAEDGGKCNNLSQMPKWGLESVPQDGIPNFPDWS